MNDAETAIVRGLVPVAWADGHFAAREQEMLEALLEAYEATDEQKLALRDFAKEHRTLDDVPVQDLSGPDRRVLLQTAVLLTFADGAQDASESSVLAALAARLRIPADEARTVIAQAEARAKAHLGRLG